LPARFSLAFVALVAASFVCGAQPPEGARFQDLKDPSISVRKNQKMLVIEAKGDPNEIGGRAFGLLFQLYSGSAYSPTQSAFGVSSASGQRARGTAGPLGFPGIR
jgi:hypothetical protein